MTKTKQKLICKNILTYTFISSKMNDAKSPIPICAPNNYVNP